MRNYKGLQTILLNIGEGGCYLLSICSHFKYEGDFVELYKKLLKKGYIDKECTVLNPSGIALLLSNEKYEVTKVKTLPKLNDGDWYIECWYNKRTGFTHFKLPDCDTLESSVTVKEGSIVSYRLFRREGI